MSQQSSLELKILFLFCEFLPKYWLGLANIIKQNMYFKIPFHCLLYILGILGWKTVFLFHKWIKKALLENTYRSGKAILKIQFISIDLYSHYRNLVISRHGKSLSFEFFSPLSCGSGWISMQQNMISPILYSIGLQW